MEKQKTAMDKVNRIEELRKRRNAVNFAIGALLRVEENWLLRLILGYSKGEAREEVDNLNWVYLELSEEIGRLMGELEKMKEGQK